MTRTRLVTTPLWSQEHLLAALAQVGFATVETHRAPVPLISWRGKPLGAEASIVIRRSYIGSSGDDFGFVRNAGGAFDAVLSEIHFSRFDRRWMEDLRRRHDALVSAAGLHAPAGLRTDYPRHDLEDAPPPLIPLPGSARATWNDPQGRQAALAHGSADATRARSTAANVLDDLRKKQRKADGPGCAVALIGPVLLWIVVGSAVPELENLGGFLLVVMPLWIAFAIVRVVRMARRARVAGRELMARLPSSTNARATAVEFLESKVKPAGAKSEDAIVKELLKALREPRT